MIENESIDKIKYLFRQDVLPCFCAPAHSLFSLVLFSYRSVSCFVIKREGKKMNGVAKSDRKMEREQEEKKA